MKHVFLDSNIVISAGNSPYGPEFARVIDLILAERIKLLTTDLTVAEVMRHYVKGEFEEIKCICEPRFRRLVEDSVKTQVPPISEEELWVQLREKHRVLVNKKFKNIGAITLRVSEVETYRVFSEYFNERGLFADGRGKKHQFPDAFVFERLKDEASQQMPIIIVSKDKDFEQPVNDQKHMSLVKSLPDLFGELGLKLEDPEIEEFLEQNLDVLIEMVDDELPGWLLDGNLENSGIIGTAVNSVEFQDTIAFKSADKGGSILVVGRFNVQTIVSFMHPEDSTSRYGSARKRLKYFNTVESENEIELEIDVSLSIAVDDEGDPVKIEELEFRNDNFADVRLDPFGDYW